LVTAVMCGFVGVAAGLYMQKQTKIRHYVSFAVVATLVYDFITGPIMSSIIGKMSFSVALIGQIPFTLWHLGGNIVFAMLLSPSLYHWVVSNKKLELNTLLARFKASA
jgi:hypothetical protein